jgi:branched-chain amino acid transport system ATP-binding protein
LLELEGVTVRFGGVTAVSEVSLRVGADDVVGLVGPNGAGKTTLFNAISGLVRPTSGSILFQARNVVRAPIHERARIGIARTFQIPQPMHGLTVRENLVVAQRFGAGRVDLSRIDEILEFLGLAGKADRDASSDLALTELKALELGKALATNPKLVLVDEVLAGLETSGKRAFRQRLLDVHQKYGIALIVVEHDIETIKHLCRRVCVLNFGRLIADGAPDEVFRDPMVVQSYTGKADA